MKPILLDTDDRFVGRASELAQLHAAYDQGARVVVVAGSFGVGKTRLAAQFGERWERGPVIGCALGDVCDADQLDAALAAGAGELVSGEFERGAFLDWLQRGRKALVVLDGAEGATEAVDELLDQAHQRAPSVDWLVTSRVSWLADGGGEADDGRRTLRLAPMEAGEAVELLVERLPRGAVVSADSLLTSALARELVAKLDRLPLAIELAAARCRVLSLEQLGERLEQKRLAMLRGPAGDRRTYGSVRQALLVSYEMLDEPSRRCLRRWAVFRGGFTLEAGDHVAALDEESAWSSLDVLEALVAHSLLYRVPGRPGSPPRFSMLDSVRDFALEVAEADELEEARRLQADHFARTAAQALAEPGRSEPDEVMRLLAESANFEAIFEYALERREPELACVALRALCQIVARQQGPTAKLMGLFGKCDEAKLFEGHPQLSAYAHYERAAFLLDANKLDEASEHFAQAAAPAAEAGLVAVHVRAERGQGICHLLAAELDRAEAHFERGLELAVGAADLLQQAFVHCGLCNLGWYRHDFDDALVHAAKALECIEREPQAPIEALATIHNTLGSSLGMLGMWTRARFHLERAVEYYDASHNRVSALTARFNRAILSVYSGDCDQARLQLAALIDDAADFLQDHVSVQAYFNLALIELEAQNLDAAEEHLRACRRLVAPADHSRDVNLAETLDCVEAIYLAMRGRVDEARRGLERLLATRDETPEALLSLIELVGAIVEAVDRLARGDAGAVGAPASKYLIGDTFDEDEPPGYDWVLRRILTAKAAQLGAQDASVLRVAPEARLVEWNGEVVDLRRRGPMRRILNFLVDQAQSEPGSAPIDVHRLVEAGWPDQQIAVEAALSRVYTTLRRLRDLGLREVVLTADQGYCIDPDIRVERVEALDAD